MPHPKLKHRPQSEARQSPSLTWIVFSGLVPVALLLVGLLGLLNYLTARGQILRDVEREVGVQTDRAADELSLFFKSRRTEAAQLAQSPLLRDYLKNLDYGLREEAETYRKEFSAFSSQYARRMEVYSRIAFQDPSGRERIAGTPAGVVPPAAAGLQGVPASLKPGAVFETGIRPEVRTLSYAAGVFDDEGAYRGAVVLTCDLRHVRALLNRARIGERGRAFLLDTAGRELLTFRATFPGALRADAPIPGTPLKVRLEADPAEFLAPLGRVQGLMVLMSLGVGLLILVWIGYRVRAFLRPLEAMVEGTRRFAKGDLDFRFQTPNVRELRILGDAFNEMAARLKARIQELTALREVESAETLKMDEESMLRSSMEAVARGLSLDRVGILWLDLTKREAVGRYLFGMRLRDIQEKEFRSFRRNLDEDLLLKEVIDGRTALLVKDPDKDPRLSPEVARIFRARDFLLAPICGKDRIFGIFAADASSSKRPLGEADREGLAMFANAVGLTLENAALLRNLSESESRYRTLVENSPTGIVGLSRYQWITTWNRGAEQIFGYPAADIVGKPVTALFPSGSEGQFQKLLNLVMEKGSAREYALPGIAKGGRRLDLSVSWGGAHQDFWANQEWTLVVRDVTEEKRLQGQIVHTEKLSAVGQLISGVAHELNNPLQAVVGYAQLLTDAKEGTFRQSDVRRIVENAQRCRKIIDNLLVFVRRGEVRRHPIRLERAVRAALEILDYKLKKAADVRVVLDLPHRLPCVKADFQQLSQVFVNLVNNACDAMAGTEGTREIRIRASAAEGRVRAEVSDTGPGVPEELRPRLFEPFFTTKPEGRGTGLGLAVTKRIIEEHGGRIGFECGQGRGATLWFELPAAREPEWTPPPEPRVPSIRGRSLLVVDDEPAVLEFLRRALEAEGHTVETASSLEEARAKASGAPYDLVVTDILLGHGSGLELYEEWGKGSTHPRPPFLLVTGDVLNAELEKDVKERGLTLLHKPIDLDALRQAVRTLLAAGRPKSV